MKIKVYGAVENLLLLLCFESRHSEFGNRIFFGSFEVCVL